MKDSLLKVAMKVKIIYEDDDIVIINKESGIPVIPERWNKEKLDLYSFLNKFYTSTSVPHMYVIHRIDRDCSGIVIFAKNKIAHKELCMQFERKEVYKEYKAIVKGKIGDNKGFINFPIYQRKKGPLRAIIRKDGKPAETLYELIQYINDYSYLKLIPITGRANQIRVHLSYIGHPILCDPLYNKDSLKIFDKYGNVLLDKLALHSHKLMFTHPTKKSIIEIISPLPDYFYNFLTELGNQRV